MLISHAQFQDMDLRVVSILKDIYDHILKKNHICHWPWCGKGFVRQHDCTRGLHQMLERVSLVPIRCYGHTALRSGGV